MASILVITGGIIFALMDCTHGLVASLDVFRPTQFTPEDDAVRLAMKSTRVRFLNARALVWEAWLGFNISHGLGMLLFGAATIWLGLHMKLVEVSTSALAFPTMISLIYFLLSLRFWFYLPTLCFALATACFAAAWWSY